MEASINDPVDSKMFDDNYVVAYVDVLEHAARRTLKTLVRLTC
jgi:hypothetical protein